jgi:hypothetical protein
MEGSKSSCCSKKCCIITWAIIIPIVVLLALLAFFLTPRIPQHKEEFQGVNNYALQTNYFMANVSYSIRVDNKNYVPIKIGKSHVELWHKNETYIGESNPGDLNFPARKDTTHVQHLVFETRDSRVATDIIAEFPEKTFAVRGYIRVTYLGIGKRFDINEWFEVDMTETVFRRELILDWDTRTADLK